MCTRVVARFARTWPRCQSVKVRAKVRHYLRADFSSVLPALDGHLPTKQCVHQCLGRNVAIQCRQNAANASRQQPRRSFCTATLPKCQSGSVAVRHCAPLHAFEHLQRLAARVGDVRPNIACTYCLVGRWSVTVLKRVLQAMSHFCTTLTLCAAWRCGCASLPRVRVRSVLPALDGKRSDRIACQALFGGQVVREVRDQVLPSNSRTFAPL